MARLLAFLLALSLSGSAVVAGRAPSPDLLALIDTYASGRYDQAVKEAVGIDDLGPVRRQFVQEVPLWIAGDPSRAARRRAAAAGFLLDLTAARLEADWGRLLDLVEFTCAQMRLSGAPTPFERAWDEASIALASRARARLWLLGEYATLPHQKPVNRPPPKPGESPSPKHLIHVMERFPGDPQFRLAQVVAWTWGRDDEPIRNVETRRDRSIGPLLRQPQFDAITGLEPLTHEPSVAAEAWVRTGLLQFAAGDHTAAVRAYDSALAVGTGPSMKYVAQFSAGRAFEALGQPEDAIRSYTRALEVIPDAESATVALASLQFSRDEREAAVARLDRTFGPRTTNTDPGRMIGYGSFIRWPELQAAMRAELPR
jgi:tetratricopeptide (TPR) repeat protein